MPSPPPRFRSLLLLAGLVVLVRWALLAITGMTFDDAHISLRYAENLASGAGLVYNPGERVFGASTPLYVLFLALLTKLHLPALLTARVLSALADGCTFFLWARALRGRGGMAAVAFFALAFGLAPDFAVVSIGGMETSFALLLLTLSLLADVANRPRVLGVALGLLAWVRPEGLLAGALILVLRWHRTRRLPSQPALIIGAVMLPWLIGATAYYGSPIPNSIPAKAAAYNAHRTDFGTNFWAILGYLSPFKGPSARKWMAAILLPCFAAGIWYCWRRPRLRALALLFPLWTAYLVVPRTLLFTWYFPPLLLPAYAVAAFGFGWWTRRARWRRAWTCAALGVFGWAMCAWCCKGTDLAIRLQRAELTVRKPIGLWLREHAAPNDRVALEPIGYIGYFSRCRILDEVGLVSPEMIPLNRAGSGWFGEMVVRFQPEWIVERPYYLEANRTINSEAVPMFGSPEQRTEFEREYERVAEFASDDVPPRHKRDYRFVIYRRR